MTLQTRDTPICKANDFGHDLYRWKIGHSQWACCAYDHGPFCRRCQEVKDKWTDALLNNVEDGTLQIWDSDKEGWKFQISAEGQEQVRLLLESDPEARRIYETGLLNELYEGPDSEGRS